MSIQWIVYRRPLQNYRQVQNCLCWETTERTMVQLNLTVSTYTHICISFWEPLDEHSFIDFYIWMIWLQYISHWCSCLACQRISSHPITLLKVSPAYGTSLRVRCIIDTPSPLMCVHHWDSRQRWWYIAETRKTVYHHHSPESQWCTITSSPHHWDSRPWWWYITETHDYGGASFFSIMLK